MPSYHGNINMTHLQILLLSHKRVCSHHVQSCHTKELLGVVDTFLLQDLGSNWDGGVHWVADDINECISTITPTAAINVLTMPTLMLKRSSRVIPGFRGTPAARQIACRLLGSRGYLCQKIILLVGAKLQVIITKMGRRTHDMADVVKGTPMVQPGDDLFWFGQPRLVLLLINFVLFLNTFQLAFFFWSWYTFGFRSCFHHRLEDIIIRITMGVIIQFLCSYVTLPLYTLVTQMGSRMKTTVCSDQVAKALKTWHHAAKKNMKHDNHSAPTSPFSSRPGTPLHGSTSPMYLLHRYRNNSSLDSPLNRFYVCLYHV